MKQMSTQMSIQAVSAYTIQATPEKTDRDATVSRVGETSNFKSLWASARGIRSLRKTYLEHNVEENGIEQNQFEPGTFGEIDYPASGRNNGQKREHKRSRVIDAMRGLAALWVLFFHAVLYLQLPLRGGLLGNCPHWLIAGSASQTLVTPDSFKGLDLFLYALVQPLLAGHLGVAMFFVISGFCIHMPLARARMRQEQTEIETGKFLKRRFFRLYPTHCFAIAGSVALVTLTHRLLLDRGMGPIIPMPVSVLLAHFSMLQAQLTWASGYVFYYNANLWSLETEVQLYLVYLLFSRFNRPLNWFHLLVFLALAELLYYRVTLGLNSFEWGWAVKTFFFGHLYEWYLGAFLVEQFLKKDEGGTKTISVLALLCAVIGLGRCLLPGFDPISTEDMAFATAFAVSLWWMLANEKRILDCKLRLVRFVFTSLEFLGERSYSIYLWQSPVIRSVVVAAIALAPSLGAHYCLALLVSLTAGLLALVAGLVAFDLVEKHFLFKAVPQSHMNARYRIGA